MKERTSPSLIAVLMLTLLSALPATAEELTNWKDSGWWVSVGASIAPNWGLKHPSTGGAVGFSHQHGDLSFNFSIGAETTEKTSADGYTSRLGLGVSRFLGDWKLDGGLSFARQDVVGHEKSVLRLNIGGEKVFPNVGISIRPSLTIPILDENDVFAFQLPIRGMLPVWKARQDRKMFLVVTPGVGMFSQPNENGEQVRHLGWLLGVGLQIRFF